MAVETLKLLTREFLGRDDVFIGAASIDDDILDIMHRIQTTDTHSSHNRVGLVRKNAFLGTSAQETHKDKKCYN